MSCVDCQHRTVCAVRKAFDGPIKRLAATSLDPGAEDYKEMLSDQVATIGEKLDQEIAAWCGVPR